MLLLLILPVWALGLLLVAGLCFAARLGDSEQLRGAIIAAEQIQARDLAAGDARCGPAPAQGAERSMQASLRREIAA
jgi:hypothetical protein